MSMYDLHGFHVVFPLWKPAHSFFLTRGMGFFLCLDVEILDARP